MKQTLGHPSLRLILGLTGAVLLAACGRLGGSGATSDNCAPYAAYGDLRNKKVSLYTAISAPQDRSYIESFTAFEDCTGVSINMESSKEFEAQLPVRVRSDQAPDLAIIPQPGLLKKLVATGKVVSAPKEVRSNVEKYFTPQLRLAGSVKDTFYAAPLGANVKSYVWYSPKAFAAKGYSVPNSFAELRALTETIRQSNPDGKSRPWCAGIESGNATGWVVTDWLEDFVLRVGGLKAYDEWVSHKKAFNDPEIAEALALVGEILKNPEYVNGGLGDIQSVASTPFADAGKPILDRSCWLHRQADQYAANWDAGTKVAPDGDVWAFYLPAIDPAQGKPVLIGGEFLAAFSQRPEVVAVQTYLSSLDWVNAKAKATPATGGWVSANRQLNLNLVKSPIDRQSVRILQDPLNEYRFDASDQMPAEVGSGSFWTWMTKWILGASDSETLDAIEKSWPQSE